VPAPVSDLKTEVSQILGESVHQEIKAEWLNWIKSGVVTLNSLRELSPDERIAMLRLLNPYFELPAPSDKTHENAHTSEESKATEVSTASGTPSSQPT
jgi:hypothetical protein